MIKVITSGKFKKTEKKLKKFNVKEQIKILHKYGQLGVEQLKYSTPVDTGKTAMSWSYRVDVYNGRAVLTFENSNQTKMGIPVALLIQYGHATRDGYFVKGLDYINPALKPVFEKIAKDSWEEVSTWAQT